MKKIILALLFLFLPLAILPKSLFALFSVALCILLFLMKKIKFNKLASVIGVAIIAHLISIIFFALRTGASDISRIVAAMNIIISWFASLIVFSAVFDSNIKGVESSSARIASYNVCTLFTLAVLCVVCARTGRTISVFGRDLYIIDWTSAGKGYRALLFFEYSSLITLFAIINLSIIGIFSTNKFLKWSMAFISLLPVYLSKSRICIVAFAVFLGLSVLYEVGNRLGKYKRLFNLSAIVLMAVFVFVFRDYLLSEAIDFLMSRSNSNSMRLDIYYYSIKTTIETNVLIGSGVKTYFSGTLPLGSHSTLVGTFYKTGLAGLACFVFAYSLIVKNAFSFKNIWARTLLVSLSIILLFEDIDGTNWLVFYAFFAFGVYGNVFFDKNEIIAKNERVLIGEKNGEENFYYNQNV